MPVNPPEEVTTHEQTCPKSQYNHILDNSGLLKPINKFLNS